MTGKYLLYVIHMKWRFQRKHVAWEDVDGAFQFPNHNVCCHVWPRMEEQIIIVAEKYKSPPKH